MLIVSTVALEDIKLKDDIANKDEIFLLETIIDGKKYWLDDNFNSTYRRLFLCSLYYNKKPICYLMTNNYYYKTNIFKMLQNTCSIWCMEKVPPYISEARNETKYSMLKKENIVFDDNDIKEAFMKLSKHNYRNDSICKVIIGED